MGGGIFPHGIRATIHMKNIPVLGLRVYPEYKLRSTLLPYHGIAVIEYVSRMRRHRVTIEPELLITGDVTRIIDPFGVTVFYERHT